MLPRRIITVAAASSRRVSVVRNVQLREIGMPASLAHLKFFSSRPDDKGKPEEHDTRNNLQQEQDQEHQQQIEQQHQPQQQQQQPKQQQRDQSTDGRPTRPRGMSSQRRKPTNRRRPPQHSGNEKGQTSKKKWRAPFWLPPHSSLSSRRGNPSNEQQQQQQTKEQPRIERRTANRFRDASMPCRKHLDPNKSMGFPTSDWVQIFGALPTTSLEEVLDSIENVLRKEAMESDGIIDLDAEWNPHRDGEDLPLVPSIIDYPIAGPALAESCEYVLDNDAAGSSNNATIDANENENINNDNNNNNDGDGDGDIDLKEPTTTDTTVVQMESFRVVKAHVVLSPFGRPTGWNLKLANPSMVYALLSFADNARVQGNLRIGWKFAKVKEYHPPTNTSKTNESSHDPSDTRTMLVVSDSMVRFENCPPSLTKDYVRHMLSRYELTPKGPTIVRWKGVTSDGRVPPLTFVARFASPAYARAAVREMQGKLLEGRPMKLIQYPRQLL